MFKLLLVVLAISGAVHALSRQQLKNSGKVMKKTCMPKHEVNEDQIGGIESGKFLEDRNVMCYIACIFQMSQVVKNNKLNYEASIKQVDKLYPPEMKEPVKAAMAKCRDVSKKHKDLCESSYWTAKCMFDTDSKNFVFP
nr:Odorant-binding protein 1 [Metisa plana]